MKKFLDSMISGGRAKAWRFFVLVFLVATAATIFNLGGEFNKGADWLKGKTSGKISLPHVQEKPFRLGLDLLGGTQLTYQADVSAVPSADRVSAVDGVRDVIERRVNSFGVAEPNIQTNFSSGNYYVLVELAGIKDNEKAIKMIGETPLLEFKEQNAEKRQLTKEEKGMLDKLNKDMEKRAKEAADKTKKNEDFAKLADQYSQDKENEGKKGGLLEAVTVESNPELFNIAKSLKPGQVSDLKKTATGYELVKLESASVKSDPFTKQPDMEVKASHLLICYKGAQMCESNLSKEDAKKKAEKLKTEINEKNFKDLVKVNSTEPGAKDTAGDLGWFGKGKMVKGFDEAVFAAKKGQIVGPVETEFGFHIIYKQDERTVTVYKLRHIFLKTMTADDLIGNQSEWKNTELGGNDLKRAVVVFNPNDGTPQVSLEFNDAGAKLFADITARNVGKPVAIYLDGFEISAPNVNEKISGGKAVISGKFDVKEAKMLATRLNAGALPVPISLVNQQTVGATLGQKSVTDSLRAGLYGFAFVALFMILFYRLPGILAILALGIYTTFVLAIFKMTTVTLTLSGLAGFIMSIGMAVDANILIFARMREELFKGKPLGLAIEEGFRRAWPSIRDSNASTLITCFILIQFSTSVVKGFAVTLSIGVLASMFTAIFVTRTLLKLLPEKWLERHAWLVGATK